MARDWEATIRSWTKPSSDTEAEKCSATAAMVKDAIAGSGALSTRNIIVFAQGSYQNNTNVRLNSDVDICVCCRDTFFYENLPNGLTPIDVGIVNATYTFAQFRNEVWQALVAKFGGSAVVRGNKAFDIHANTYHVDADVLACFEGRRYRGTKANWDFVRGTAFTTDNGQSIHNWPEQHYGNGVDKNRRTGNRYKYIARALKRLRYEMIDKGVAGADGVSSFLLECLAWNTPDGYYGHDLYLDDVKNMLGHAFNSTSSDAGCEQWTEVSGLKLLFGTHQPWTRQQANVFLFAAWLYIWGEGLKC